MPDFWDSKQQASKLTSLFMEFVRKRLSSLRKREPEYGLVAPRSEVYTADIDDLVERFATSLYVSSYLFGDRFPVVHSSGGSIPIDLSRVVGPGRSRLIDLIERAARFLPPPRPLFRQSPFVQLKIKYEEPREVESIFQNSLFDFLYTRFEARESDVSEQPGRLFEVRTSTHGLRVNYSTVFLFDPYQVFGSPTSPVRAWIQPGNYYFGAVGPGIPLWFDMESKYEIPRMSHAQLQI